MDEFIPTRNSLLSRMRDWDDYESWREFFDTYWRFLYGIALRCGLSNEDARDVVQETVLAAAKGLREGRFHRAGRGSFKNWLELIVRRRVNDHLRRARVRPPSQADHFADDGRTPVLERIPDPAGNIIREVWQEEWARNVAEVAMERVKARVSAKQFQVFDLYVVKGWPVREVVRALRVNIAQVYLAKHRITALLRQETQRIRHRMETDGGLG